MATTRLKEWFLTKTSGKKRFVNGDKPDFSTFSDLFKSQLFRANTGDRAKEDDGTSLQDITGHVVASTDVQVKAKTAKATDRTRIVQPSQLPAVEANVSETVGTFTGQVMDVTVDPTETGFSKYLLTLGTDFKAWLIELGGKLSINTNDAAPSEYLDTKIVGGSGITLSLRNEANDGPGNEKIEINAIAPSGLLVYYVDSNNSVDGDGSVLNPYKTLDLAHAAVIGSGSASNPENSDVSISVAKGAYITDLNLVIKDTTWIFQETAEVDYQETGYLFDTTILSPTGISRCYVRGGGIFETSTGGIIKAEGTSGVSNGFTNYKTLEVECTDIRSTMVSPIPVIYTLCSLYVAGGRQSRNDGAELLNLSVKGSISSAYGTIMHLTNGSRVDFSGVSTCTISAGSSSLSSDNLILIEEADNVIFRNTTMYGIKVDDMVYLKGELRDVILDHVTIRTTSSTSVSLKPSRFLTVDALTTFTSKDKDNLPNPVFLITNLVEDGATNFDTGFIITSNTGSALDQLTMQYSFLKGTLNNINLGVIDNTSCVNIYNGVLQFDNIPTSAPTKGVWSNGGVLTLV